MEEESKEQVNSTVTEETNTTVQELNNIVPENNQQVSQTQTPAVEQQSVNPQEQTPPVEQQSSAGVPNETEQPQEAVNQVDVAPKTINVNGQVLDNKCRNCGAPLLFNAELGNWKCNYCDSVFTLDDLQNYNNAGNEKNNLPPSEVEYQETNENVNFVNYKCKNCGAEIIADEQTAATFCVYCGNTAILQDKLSGSFAPDQIIPFSKAKKTATEAFKSLSKGRPLMPKGFNDEKNIEKIRGVYIPFWLYNIGISGQLIYKAEKVRTWRMGDKVYTKTDYYDVTREGQMSFDKIPMDASTRFDNDIMNSIEPFDYAGLKKYNHAYLSGFLAEKHDDDEQKIQEAATKRAINSTINQMDTTLRTYSSKRIISNNLVASSIERNYALFPVWMVNVKYNNQQYIFAMNGQTGKFIGNIPIDKKKAALIGVATFAITFIIVIIISIIVFISKGGSL